MSLFSLGKSLLNKYPSFLHAAASAYSVLSCNRIKVSSGNTLDKKGTFLKHCKIKVSGTGNRVILGRKAVLNNVKIILTGTNNTVIIGDEVFLSGVDIVTEDSNNTVKIGKQTRMFGPVHIACIEGTCVEVGEDCLFSSEIHIRTGDSHSVLDLSGNRTNFSKDIRVADHVWLGHRCTLTKGAAIPRDSIVSLGAIVTKAFDTPNVVLGGVPAKVLKENVNWNKQRIPASEGTNQ